MSDAVEKVYVYMLDENMDVWCPVLAKRIQGNFFKILPQAYDREIEHWQFEPGDEVRCEFVDLGEGKVLAAVSRAQIDTSKN